MFIIAKTLQKKFTQRRPVDWGEVGPARQSAKGDDRALVVEQRPVFEKKISLLFFRKPKKNT